MSQQRLKLALICGGPSLERGISLNSARSVMNHLTVDGIEIQPYYIDHFLNFYEISTFQLYSNTPSDFDFKLANTATQLSEEAFITALKQQDLVFPAIHGAYGEDGELQALLEKHHIPFIGSGSQTCKAMFHKYLAAKQLAANGYETLDSILLHKKDHHAAQLITQFFEKHSLERAIIKPVAGGSSIGVFSATSPAEAAEKANQLFAMNIGEEAILESFCDGKEFTVIVLQTEDQPVALIPTEIQVSYDQGKIFDYRRKYLPTSNTRWHCPPQFSDDVIKTIQQQAETLFSLFNMRDCARLDGWLLHDGRILFTDFNPLSGMEQNSFIFQQASRVGMTHQDLLLYIVRHACMREQLSLPVITQDHSETKTPVHVLFGGKTAERQVSLMSGTNVWLKLRKSKQFKPKPYFLDPKGRVWHLPYTYTLNHTVEEIAENCLLASSIVTRLKPFCDTIRQRLNLTLNDYQVQDHLPIEYSLDQFLQATKKVQAFLFIALHGGDGENGTLQQLLSEWGILYNGSDSQVSAVCMDKHLTGMAIANLGDLKLITAPKKCIQLEALAAYQLDDFNRLWQELTTAWKSQHIIIKPQHDGCSAGIARLYNTNDLVTYVKYALEQQLVLPPHTLSNQPALIEMPPQDNTDYLLEAFIETDKIYIEKNELFYHEVTGWLELTVGVLEREGQYTALNPSITVSEHHVLSLEEKFQGGTGVNITPPPVSIITSSMLDDIKKAIVKTAAALHIKNYARIDIFFNNKTGQTLVIEVNSLPALTPATVIYHQALAANPPMEPTQLLELLIKNATSCDQKPPRFNKSSTNRSSLFS